MKILRKLIALTVILTQSFWSISGYADVGNFNNIQTVSGAGSVDRSQTNEIILTQATSKWHTTSDDLSLAANEKLQVIQPNSSSVYMDTVTGGSPSNIFGSISSNGLIFLINQNGVLFARGSSVNVGGLIASTLDISDAQFQSGQFQTTNSLGQLVAKDGYYFIGAGGFGSVINSGNININAPGGFAALLGSSVENSGSIVTTAGSVALASGKEIAVNLDPKGAISAVIVKKELAQNLKGKANTILNTGTIKANGGQVILTAKSLKGLFANLINNTGIIEASSSSTKDGVVTLSAKGGTLANSGTINGEKSVTIKTDGSIDLTGGMIQSPFGDVSITTKDQIVDNNSSHVANIIAQNLKLSAANGIGSASGLYTDVGYLTALNSTSGKIKITNDKSFNAASVINNGSTAGDDIKLRNTSGDMEVGTVSAGGLGNVKLISGGSITDNDANSMVSANQLRMIARNNIGSKKNRINTNANDIYAVSKVAGDINLNQATSVTLSHVFAANGKIDIIADGQMTARDVSTGGGAGNDISLKTIFGDIDIGSVNAANGLGDVSIDSAGNIYGIDSGNLIKGNNLSLTAGVEDSPVGTLLTIGNGVSIPQLNGPNQTVVIKNQPGATSYDIYFKNGLFGTWQKVADNVPASISSTTTWTDPSPAVTGVFASYQVVVSGIPETSIIGTGAIPINTNVNTIRAVTKDIGDININQATAVTLSHVLATDGKIGITAGGKITAQDVSNAGGVGNDISLKTSYGDIEVGSVNASNKLGDVSIDAAGNITDNDANSMVTSNNLNLNAGITGSSVGNQLNLGTDINTYVQNGHQVLSIKNQPGAGSYDIYFRTGFSGQWQKVAGNVAASNSATTLWSDPSTPIIGAVASYYAQVATAQTSNIGSSINPINTNVNNISSVSKVIGDININQATAVTLSHVLATDGKIGITAGGKITAQDVSNAGGVGNDISLKTSYGDIEVGSVNASNKLGDVSIDAAGNITDNDANSMVTSNNLNLNAGITGSSVGNQLNLGTDINTYVQNGHQVLSIKNQPGAGSYDIYFRTGFSGQWQKVAGNVAASNSATTLWSDPSAPIIGGFASYYAQVATAQTSNIGSSINPINTNVNNISSVSKVIGDINIKQATAVTLSHVLAANGMANITSMGDMKVGSVTASQDVSLESVNGSIVSAAAGTNVTSGADTHIKAGNLIGSSSPNAPLNINVGKDLYVAAGGRAGTATGSVGTMPVSGTLEGPVIGVNHIDPGTSVLNNNVFNGNPPGYVFLNSNEIWPNLPPSTPTNPTNLTGLNAVNDLLAARQLASTIQPNLKVYFEKEQNHLIRQVEVAAPIGVYSYHSLVDADSSAVDNIKLEPEAYDYIDQHINLINPMGSILPDSDQKKSKSKTE